MADVSGRHRAGDPPEPDPERAPGQETRAQRRDAGAAPLPAPSEERIAELLRAAALRREPDRERIFARIEPALDDPRRRGDLPFAAASGRRLSGRDVARLAAVSGAAASVVVAVAALQGLTGAADKAERQPVPAASGPSAAPVTPATADPTPTATGSAVATRSPSRTRTATPPRETAASTPDRVPSQVPVSIAEWGAGDVLTLTPDGGRDWIVTGARQDGKLVRREQPVPLIGAPEVRGATTWVSPGPFTVRWSGGIPEEDRADDRTWLTLPAAAGSIRLTVPAAGVEQTVRLYVGAAGSQGRVVARVGSETTTVDVPADRGSIVIVRLAAGDAGDGLVVDVTGDGGSGVVGLAAVVLS
jgi:hypothetical protein